MVALIVAHDKNRVIGNKGRIPWNIDGEKQRFKELTTGNIVIMGRRTFEEIGRPLPNRKTIVVSNTKNFDYENCKTVKSLKEALKLKEDKEVFISGGQRLYEEALSLVEKMYITKIEGEFEGDAFFPEFNNKDFDLIVKRRIEGNIPYTYYTYVRKQD